MKYRYFSALKLLKSLIDSQPLILRKLVLVQINSFINRLIVTKVHIKLSIESWVHSYWRADSQKPMEIIKRWINLLSYTEFHEVTPIMIQILVSQIATPIIINYRLNKLIFIIGYISTSKNIRLLKYFSGGAYFLGEIRDR